MELLENKATNIALENITFAPNHVVMMRKSERWNERENTTNVTIRWVEVCPVKDTKETTLICSIIRFMLAETKVNDQFVREYSETGITNKKILTKYLNSNVIFRTDSNGKISKSIISEIPFKDTALNIRPKHALMHCKNENLKGAIFSHAKAVLAQCSYIANVKDEAKRILDIMDKEEIVKVSKPKAKTELEAVK